MYGFISGFADTEGVDFCPFCGKEIFEYFGDGSCRCEECDRRFAVIEVDDE